jgi:alpha/beta superfamily hydrolase
VTASLDPGGADSIVVACPPHPELGGTRSDSRLKAVAAALGERSIACLRFDYGPWSGGSGEQTDVENALAWAGERYETVGLFGYSFGANLSLFVAADREDLAAVSTLAPGIHSTTERDLVGHLERSSCPLQVIYGQRDETVDSEPVAERVRELGHTVQEMSTDHHFIGYQDRVGEMVASFFQSKIEHTA